jgi:cell division protein ZapB
LNELNALESRMPRSSSLCQTLRAENDGLREQLAAAETDKNRLTERMGAACARLEALALQLPEAKA